MNNNDLENRLRRLEEAFETFSKELRLAFQYIQPDAESSLGKSRTVLEKLIRQIYIAEMGREPKKPLLGDMLADNQFTRKIDRRIFSRMNAIRDLGNLGAHGEHVVPSDATRALDDLAEVLDWYLQWSEKTELNKDENPKKGDNNELITMPPSEPVPPLHPDSTPPREEQSIPKELESDLLETNLIAAIQLFEKKINRLHIKPNIPLVKMNNAKNRFLIPEDETILALVDNTAWDPQRAGSLSD